MKASYNSGARRRAVNLTLNEDLVVQACGLTDNLSGVVESLLTDFVEQERLKRLSHEKTVQATIATWNEFSDKQGTFADDHSTLWWRSLTFTATRARTMMSFHSS